MAWESIENVKPASTKANVPAHGVTVATRRAMNDVRFIVIKIGADLARAAKIAQPEQVVRLMFGTGADAGKIACAVDMGGGFRARRQKNGCYQLTINRAAADGLFSLDFPTFTVDRCEAVRPENGQPPMFTFKASPAMLEVSDD